MKQKYTLLALLLFLVIGSYWGWNSATETPPPATQMYPTSHNAAPQPADNVTATAAAPAGKQAVAVSPEVATFAGWLKRTAGTAPSAADLQEGIALAQAREAKMQNLIRTDPASALAQAVSLREYATLPAEVKPYVERPFSAQADVMVLPDETGIGMANKPRFDPTATAAREKTVLQLPGQNMSPMELYRYGERAGMLSKDGIAAQGIALDGVAAIRPAAVQIVSGDDASYVVKNFPAHSADTQHDSYSGQAIQGKPVVGLAGGQVFYFASAANAEKLNVKLGQLEQQTGPKTGSQILFQPLMAPGASPATVQTGALSTQLDQLLAVPGNWTTSPKTVFYIRVDFPDKPGEPITKPALETALANSSAMIAAMSQGKTKLDYTVSDAVVRLPLTGAAYLAQGAGQLHSDAVAAFGASNPGITLSNYDIVGVYFNSIGYGWAGLASVGGSSQWLQAYSGVFPVTHEFGHNYGLNHAHSWNTTDGSAVGVGASEDYGDIYDFMGASYSVPVWFHPQALSKLNWLAASNWQDVTTSGTYRIYRFDDANASGNRALRVSRGGTNGYYWIGHCQRFDANNYMESGLYLLWQQNGTTDGWLLDTTPNSAGGKNDAAIVLGRTYSDTASNIHITPTAKGGTAPNEWMDVQVNLGVPAGNTPPRVGGINGAGNIPARSNTTFSASASDPDGDALSYQWDFGDGIINPDTAEITHQWAVGGTYTVKLTVSDMKGGTASTTMTVTVTDPLTNWAARTSNSTQNLQDIASDGSKAIAVGSGGNVLTSTDGATWAMADLGGNVELYGIYYANGLWVAVGDDYRWNPTAGWVGVVYTSPDGTTWTRRYTDGNTGTTLKKVTYGNGRWVAVGNAGTVLSSTDGITWAPQTSGTSNAIYGVAYGNGEFVAVAGYWGGSPNLVLTSADGASWIDRTNGSGTGNSLWYVGYLKDRFVASGWFNGIRYSTDNGVTFQTGQPSSQSTPANAYGNGLYFSAGVNNPQQSTETDINLVSTDGMSWSLLATSSQPNRNAAIFFKNTFITVGQGGSIYQSGVVPHDSTPDAFSFAAQTDVPLSSAIISAPVQITGIDTSSPWATDNNSLACVSSGNNCNCDVQGLAASGTVVNGQYMCVQHTSASSYATSVSTTLTVGGVSGNFGSTTLKNSQTVSFGSLGGKTLGAVDFSVNATASSGLAVSFSSQTGGVCTVTGSLVHLVAVGTCTIRASQVGNATYGAATDVDQSFTVNAAPAAINGNCGSDNGKALASAPTNLCAAGAASSVTSGNSSYTWNCASSNGGSTAACSSTRNYTATSSVNGGNGSISASQTVAYNATPAFTLAPAAGYVASSVAGSCGGALNGNTFTTDAVTADCTVVANFAAQNSQTITFAALSGKTLGAADFSVNATASSGLVVSFSSQTGGVCTVTGGLVHLVSAGTCTIRASQAGNATYGAAADVDQSFTVTPPPVVINGGCGSDNGKTLASTPIDLCAAGIASSVTSGNSNYTWGCTGSNGGGNAICAATRTYLATVGDEQGGDILISAPQGLSNVSIVPEASATLVTTGKPSSASYTFPDGIIQYTTATSSVGGGITITVTFPNNIPANSKVYKIDNKGYKEFAGATISGKQVTLTLVDGGAGDADGVANGIIVDPVAVAIPVTSTGSTATSSGGGGGGSFSPEWLALMGLTYALIRRREKWSLPKGYSHETEK